MSFGQPVATAYEADLHCLACTQKRFGETLYDIIYDGRVNYADPRYPQDSEGNPVSVLLEGQNDEDLEGQVCGDCAEPLCPYFPDCVDWPTKEEGHQGCARILKALKARSRSRE